MLPGVHYINNRERHLPRLTWHWPWSLSPAASALLLSWSLSSLLSSLLLSSSSAARSTVFGIFKLDAQMEKGTAQKDLTASPFLII